MKRTSRLLFLFSALALAACGFSPMYGSRSSATAEILSGIAVEPMDGRLGQTIRNALIDRLTLAPGAAPRYRLTVSPSRTATRYGFRPDASVSRGSVRLSGHFVLADSASGAVILDETTRSVATYDIVQSDFASVEAEREAEKRTVEQLSDQIVRRIAAVLNARPDQQKPDQQKPDRQKPDRQKPDRQKP